MIRVNHQRLGRQRLPIRFLVGTLLVALLWFIVMFLYVDDLISEEARDARPPPRHRRRAPTAHHPPPPHLAGGGGGEEGGAYENENAWSVAIEKVEDEYVEIWEHGKWVRGRDRLFPSVGPTTTVTTKTTTTTLTPRPTDAPLRTRSAAPPSTIATTPAPLTKTTKATPGVSVVKLHSYDRTELAGAGQIRPLQGHANKIQGHNSMPRHKSQDVILVDDDNARKSTSRDVLSPVGRTNLINDRSNRPPGPVVNSSEDFHFALTEPLPHGLGAGLKTNSTILKQRLLPEWQGAANATRPVDVYTGAHHLAAGQLGGPLIEPHQLPLPRHSGSSRRVGGRRSKHSRGHYREPQRININAKPGARMNYVNINPMTLKQQGANRPIRSNGTLSSHALSQSQMASQKVNGTLDVPAIVGVNSKQFRLYSNSSAHKTKHNMPTGGQKANILFQGGVAASLDAQRDLRDGYNRHSFNITASNAVPVLRPLPDTRPKSCPSISPASPPSSPLPMATVVICFHNEAWSTLLRTIHSVLARSPEQLLKEVILVDDYSSYDYLGGRLETYIAKFPQVQLVRTHRREGLIRARLLGVSYARGDILVFLDSHCECNGQWLEPLVDAIMEDKKKIVCPQIDIINPNTFVYERAPANLHGGFSWHLQFVWKQPPAHTSMLRTKDSDPISTPTMIGGLFAVNRRYFLDVGSYDPGMDIWGGENLELSFRVWMCGGSIEILPCSRVGHLFRPVIPYGFPGGAHATLHRNAMRVAEVWMDQYKKFYYASQDMPRDMSVVSSLADRHALRRSLGCNDFSWFLKNVAPEMDIPPLNAQYFGQLRNKQLQLCLQPAQGVSEEPVGILLVPCRQDLHTQQFTVTSAGEFVQSFRCVYLDAGSPLLAPCPSVSQRWSVTKEGQIVAGQSRQLVPQDPLCLDVIDDHVVTSACDVARPLQLWSFTYRFDMNKLNKKY